ncbi:CatB-related O-acetyltransferase [Stagnihabitans tardus]|uniref:Antibiotic acetyltransferase n=1 Tax=Stagnihabitans tardus TaxID=2699202 RepID=A0AAE4YCK7_9RHOB|nr:CatB-related O-acetyltransferase [Stagnihabitans tardus]NBZ89559.1 antibiotic acetyltransferase [Stagnihabitans tardus]
MTPRLRDFLWEKRIVPKPWRTKGLDRIKSLHFPDDLEVEPYTRHVFRPGDGAMLLSSSRHMTYQHAQLAGSRIGAFCSIARGVEEMGDTHPMDRVTSHSLGYGSYYHQMALELGAEEYRPWSAYNARAPHVKIGNDVWIGAQAMLKGGITIGDGAVIGARSVVTKDVPPYAVVVGQPARILRHRFAPEICARLLATRWWDYSLGDLARFSFDDPLAFCEAFEAASPGLSPRDVAPITVAMLQEMA